ncbi:unnamed protein product, partial [Meganyctiphanes norvegica]
EGSSMFAASQSGDLAEVTKLAGETCKDVNWQNSDHFKWTPLHIAAYNNRTEVVKFLLSCKANQDMETSSGYTALIFASMYGHYDIVKLLLDNGADTLITRNDGRTALMYASIYG